MEVCNHEDTIKMNTLKRNTFCSFTQLPLRYIQKKAPFCLLCVAVTAVKIFIVCVAIPIFVRANQWILPKIVFFNLVSWPLFSNFSNPSEFGLNNTRNINLHVEDGVNIGAWHILPKSTHTEKREISWDRFDDEMSKGKNIFLYLHGNSCCRGVDYRVEMYKILSQLDFHVITIDYRGFGDSSGVSTEDGLVADAYFTYKWIKARSGQSKIFIWGHSLGTGVAAELAKILCDEGDHPAGVILEAGFNSILEAAHYHPVAWLFSTLPWFEWGFVDAMREHGIIFDSEKHILSVTPHTHILILHAKDDMVVPFKLGEKLYQKAKETKGEMYGTVEFITFEAHHGYGHKHIYQAPELPSHIMKFVAESDGLTNPKP